MTARRPGAALLLVALLWAWVLVLPNGDRFGPFATLSGCQQAMTTYGLFGYCAPYSGY